MNGDDLKDGRCWRYVIDLHGQSIEGVRNDPLIQQHLMENVAPSRAVNRESRTAKQWWLFRRSGDKLRAATSRISRYIATTRTAKFRVFQFCGCELRAESKIVVVASDNPRVLGILSSRVHEVFARRIGGFLGVGNDPTYNHTDCFEKFPFPPTDDQSIHDRIGNFAEQLDAHRKRQQELHPRLTITGMYNVLEKLRADEPLTDKEKTIHEQGLVSVLKQIHDDLDAAVFEAYGWPATLTDEEILERLVALNAERAAEEEQGLIRWLRPEFQNPDGHQTQVQATLDLDEEEAPAKQTKAKKVHKQDWPKTLPEQMAAVRRCLVDRKAPTKPQDVAKQFKGYKKPQNGPTHAEFVEELLATLVAIGQARLTDSAHYVVAS